MNSVTRIFPTLAGMALAVALAAQPAPESAPDSLLFRNGDLLYGKLLAIDSQDTVRWSHPDAAQPIEFKPGSVLQIGFPTPKDFAANSNNMCRLLLANGDSLGGELISCDHDAVGLQTWYAGLLTIPRRSLQSMVFIPHSRALFNGITGSDGWTQGAAAAAFLGESGKWVYRNGAFYANRAASIARDLKLPDMSEIQFDLAWKGNLNLAVALYTDSLQPILLTAKEQSPDFGGFYSLRFYNSAFIDLWPIRKSDRIQRQLEHSQVFYPALTTKDRLHVDLRISKPEHKIALFLDGSLVKEWDDPEGFVGEGTGLRFVQNGASVVKLSNLHINPWDGVFADGSVEAPDLTHDVIWPESGPKIIGLIQSVGDGVMTVRTTNGPTYIPFADIKAIDFARGEAAPSASQPGTVRATFADGGNLTFILERWRPDEMTVHSADFGKARFNPAAFTRLQFLLPEKKPASGPNG